MRPETSLRAASGTGKQSPPATTELGDGPPQFRRIRAPGFRPQACPVLTMEVAMPLARRQGLPDCCSRESHSGELSATPPRSGAPATCWADWHSVSTSRSVLGRFGGKRLWPARSPLCTRSAQADRGADRELADLIPVRGQENP